MLTPELRMNRKRPPFIMRKVTFCIVIDGLLQAKRRHIGKQLIIKRLASVSGLSGILGPISLISNMSRMRQSGKLIGKSILSPLPSGGLGWVSGGAVLGVRCLVVGLSLPL